LTEVLIVGLINIFLVFLIIICLEIIGGIYSERKWPRTMSLNILRNYEIKLVENQNENFSKGTYSRDKYGLRGNYDEPREITILTIGGSTTNQKYVPDGFTFQDLLSAKLSKQFGKKIKIANAGVEGHSTFAHLESLKQWFPLIPELNPKYVLLYIGINDAGFRDQKNINHDFSAHGSKIWEFKRFLRNYSRTYGVARKIRNLFSPSKKAPLFASHQFSLPFQFQYSVKELTTDVNNLIENNTKYFENRLRSILIEINEWGSIPILITQPHLFVKSIEGVTFGIANVFQHQGVEYSGLDFDASLNALSEVMKNLSKEFDGIFIDLKNREFAELDFYDYVHMTSQGVKRVANYIFDELVEIEVEL
jgi:lysophospholipase L1-like esterase